MIKVYMHRSMPECIFVGDCLQVVTMCQMYGGEATIELEGCPLDGFVEIGEL